MSVTATSLLRRVAALPRRGPSRAGSLLLLTLQRVDSASSECLLDGLLHRGGDPGRVLRGFECGHLVGEGIRQAQREKRQRERQPLVARAPLVGELGRMERAGAYLQLLEVRLIV